MKFSTAEAVSFTGNRILSAPKPLEDSDLGALVCPILQTMLGELYRSGKRVFLSGGAIGFDMLAAEEVVKLRAQYSDVKLVIVSPFDGQDAKYSTSDRQRYRSLIAAADDIVTISEQFSLHAYHVRNQYLVDNCSYMIAYSNGVGRGTASTISRATKKGIPLINIYELLGGKECAQQLNLEF